MSNRVSYNFLSKLHFSTLIPNNEGLAIITLITMFKMRIECFELFLLYFV